jgi:hypothetical protein
MNRFMTLLIISFLHPRIVISQSPPVDSITVSGRFTMPPSDGKGAIDSITVAVFGVVSDSVIPMKIYKAASLGISGQITNYQFRFVPSSPPNAGSMTLDISVLATVFRRGAAVGVMSNIIPITIIDAAPPGVLSHVITIP